MTAAPVEHDGRSAEYPDPARGVHEDFPFGMTTERPRPGVTVVTVAGPVDAVNVRRFAQLLFARLNSTAEAIVLDMTSVSFLGSDAIKVLVQADLRAHVAGQRLLLVTGNVRAVNRPLEALGLASRFTYGLRPVFAEERSPAEVPAPAKRIPRPRQVRTHRTEPALNTS